MKPTFIGIGAQKCASTWVYDILADHPEAYVSEKKELDFFSNYYDFGFEWYERNFIDTNKKIIGEISPSYFHGVSVPTRIKQYNPEVKLIVLLRNPEQRAISNHQHEVRTGHIQGEDLSFEYGMKNNPSYIEQGLYATHLENWLVHFPKEQLLVLLFDDVIKDPVAVSKRVYQFLEIDPNHQSAALTQRSNESYVNRSAGAEAIKNGVRSIIRKIGLGSLWNTTGKLGFQKIYRNLNRTSSNTVIPPMKEATKQQLKESFENEIKRLEKLIDRPLKHWL